MIELELGEAMKLHMLANRLKIHLLANLLYDLCVQYSFLEERCI